MEDGTGVVKGVDHRIVQKEMDAIADTIANVCTPRIYPKLMLANVDGKSVIVVDVPQGESTPGGLLRDITLDELKAGYSKIRNRGIAEALVYMHEVENWGGGVARYYARCAELDLPPPWWKSAAGVLRLFSVGRPS